jgi:hypothetical protein
LEQIVSADVGLDRLSNILLPAVVNSLSDLGDEDAPTTNKLKCSLISLAESIQAHVNNAQVIQKKTFVYLFVFKKKSKEKLSIPSSLSEI